MPDQPSRKRRIVLVALAFVCGALVGGVGATAAAYRASKAFMDIHRFLFTHDQVEKMRAAWKAGDMNKALSHATCAFEMTAGDAARNFDFSYVGWRWGDPRFSMDFDDRTPGEKEAWARARIAVALERLGQAGEAQTQLDAAAKASGKFNAANWRRLVLSGLDRPAWSGTCIDGKCK